MGCGAFVIFLGSWAPASSLTNFNLAWKTATLLALATAKYCLDLIFYVLIIISFSSA